VRRVKVLQISLTTAGIAAVPSQSLERTNGRSQEFMVIEDYGSATSESIAEETRCGTAFKNGGSIAPCPLMS
jgi:hypothetical protein